MFRISGLMTGVLSLLLLTGCETGPQPQPRRDPLAQMRQSGNPSGNKAEQPTPPSRVSGKNVRLRYPITNAQGKWTIRVGFFYGVGDKPAAQLADEAAEGFRKAGREAYVTDMGNRAILSVGSFKDPEDPRLFAAWKQEHDNYLRMRGGQASTFQKQMDSFHEGNGPLGDGPWPIEIEALQMRMKVTQGKITPEQYAKYRESVTMRRPGSGTGRSTGSTP